MNKEEIKRYLLKGKGCYGCEYHCENCKSCYNSGYHQAIRDFDELLEKGEKE